MKTGPTTTSSASNSPPTAWRQPARPTTCPRSGFSTVGRRFLNKFEDITDDRIDVTTRGLLGLTVACARCHDHKYDPIPAEDYYSLYGIFASSEEPDELPLLKDEDGHVLAEYQAVSGGKESQASRGRHLSRSQAARSSRKI